MTYRVEPGIRRRFREQHEAPPGARRGPRSRTRQRVVEAIRKIPAYLRLLGGLLIDSRVSALDKVVVAGAIAYVVMPLDLIPDFIPFLGQVDDVYVLMLALERLIANAGEDVVADHWTGDPRDLTRASLNSVLLASAFFLPLEVRKRLRRSRRRR